MKIGIFGGTFNPPQIGHVCAAQDTVRQLGLDSLLIIPAGIPPHKAIPDGSPSDIQRLEMVRMAFSCIDCAEISDMEIIRDGVSYTVDTVENIASLFPGAELFLLMGTDMAETFENWKDSGRILEKVTPAVFGRGKETGTFFEDIRRKFKNKVKIIRNKAVETSSTILRESLISRGGTEYFVPQVYSYIIKNKLYGAKPDFDWLRTQAYLMLNKASRIRHVAGCEEEAVRLARRWGADVNLAREAAILHDITKKYELDDQLILCEKYGIMLDNVEKSEYKLLHAKTGAAVACDEFGVQDEVYNAIFRHTTGSCDMTLLEKIIYIADYIEPNRDFEGVRKLSLLAYEDLDRALLMGLEMSVEDMRARGIIPHVSTSEAIEYLKAGDDEALL